MTRRIHFEGDCQGPLQDDWRIVDASSADWTLPESRKCRKCAKDLVRSTEDTVLAIARIDWLEVDIGISNVHVVCETCAMADQPILDWI